MKEFEIGTIYKLNREYFTVLMAFDRNWKGHDSNIPHYISIKKIGTVNLHFDEYGEGFTEWYYKTDLQLTIKQFTSLHNDYPMLIEEVSKEDVFKDALIDLS
ncbi:MAG: hypothetical protein PQJ61_14520, partial [Spirochaetales bacterium]|nr:hypothetical protein [Spirochaetales bacterium]